MTKETVKKGGRKPKYQDEELVRLGALVRPRYKEMLEIIAKARRTSLNAAIEYCIVVAARDMIIDEKSIYEWVVPYFESIERLYKCTNLTRNPISIQAIKEMKLGYIKDHKIPVSLQDPSFLYVSRIFLNVDDENLVFFDFGELTAALDIGWAELNDDNLTIEYINTIGSLIARNSIPAYSNSLSDSDIKEIIDKIISLYINVKINTGLPDNFKE